ncbi:acyltransferase [soil metagenome]
MLHAVFRRDHIPVLDGLRGVAVLLVLYSHLPTPLLGAAWERALRYGRPGLIGVDLFFVLSGFLITRILLVDRARGRPLHLFLFKRFLRIFPIYYLLIAVLWFAAPGAYLIWGATYTLNVYQTFSATAAAGPPLGHAWSMAVEEHFYMLWPLVVMFLPLAWGRRIATWLGPVCIVVAAVIVVYGLRQWTSGWSGRALFFLTPFRMLALLAGAALAYHEGWVRADGGRAARLGWLLLVGGALVMIITKPMSNLIGSATLTTGAVLLALAGRESRAGAVLSSRGLRYVGRISYGLYLYHAPIYGALDSYIEPGPGHVVENDPLLWAAAVTVTFLVASYSYLLIERPLLKLKDRIAA